MDLIKSILEQFSGDNLDKLSSQLGTDARSTRSAVEAAVPALLSGLSGLAATDEGAQRLAATLGNLDHGSAGNLGSILGGATSALTQKGGGLLSSLFGDNVLSGIMTAVGRYAHLDSSIVKKLLSFVAPFILGKVAWAWTGKGGTPAALQSLFAEQKANIADAIPSGFSLAGIPGVDAATRLVDRTAQAAGDASRRAAGAAEDAAKSSGSWLVPLVTAALVVGLGLWYVFSRRPVEDAKKAAVAGANAVERAAKSGADAAGKAADKASDAIGRTADGVAKSAGDAVTALKPTIPDANAVTKELSTAFTSAKQALAGIKDAESAQAALPKLTELNTGIDRIREQIDKLPAAGQATMGKLVSEQFGPIQQQAAKILEMPDVSDEVRSSLENITSKLAGLNLAQVSEDATGILAQLTKALNGVKDSASAEKALPQLEEVAGKIDALKQVQAQMSPGGQSMLAKLISTARGPLTQLIAKVASTLDTEGGAIRKILDEIVKKLAVMAPAQET